MKGEMRMRTKGKRGWLVVTVDVDRTVELSLFGTGSPKMLAKSREICPSEVGSDGYFDALSALLMRFLQSHPEVLVREALLILSDRLLTIDRVEVPDLGRRATASALEIVVERLYPNLDELLMLPTRLFSLEGRLCYRVLLCRRVLLDGFRRVFSGMRIAFRVTHSAGVLAYALSVCAPRLLSGRTLLLAVGEAESHAVALWAGKPLGRVSFPIGEAQISAASERGEAVQICEGAAERYLREVLGETGQGLPQAVDRNAPLWGNLSLLLSVAMRLCGEGEVPDRICLLLPRALCGDAAANAELYAGVRVCIPELAAVEWRGDLPAFLAAVEAGTFRAQKGSGLEYLED